MAGGVARLARQSLAVTQVPVSAATWRGIPSTYVVCTEDRGTAPGRQRAFAERPTYVVELATGHHPSLSRPDAVAEVVLGLV